MSKDRLKHSLEELFSDFTPPAPEGEIEPSNLPPRSGVRAAVGDTPQEHQPAEADAPRRRDPNGTVPLPEKEPLPGQEGNINGEKDVNEDQKADQENNSPSEDTVRTWRAGWRGLASDNLNGKGRTDSAKRPIGSRRRRTR